jgi:hypothetical protein
LTPQSPQTKAAALGYAPALAIRIPAIQSPTFRWKNESVFLDLLIDLDDSRCRTRARLLTSYGYSVEVRDEYVSAERLKNEGEFDPVIVALHKHPKEAAAYSDHLSVKKPLLPILLLTD